MTEKKAKEKTDEPVDLEAINKRLSALEDIVSNLSERFEAIIKAFNDMAAKLRRYGANWKRFANIFIGDHNDGEVK